MSTKPLIENGNKIVFAGDSITAAPQGYVKVTENVIAALAPEMKLTFINAGIGGNKVTDLLVRVGEDIIAHDPDWITVSIGINDVWHGVNGTPLDVFAECYEELVRILQKQTVAQLALFTTTVIGENLDSEANRRLIPYNNIIRQTARKYKTLLVPMNEEFHKAISTWQQATGENDLRFTTDGVHMQPAGDFLMALTLIRSWGFL